MSLAKLEQQKLGRYYELQELRFAYENKKKELESKIAELEKQQGLLLANMDEDLVKMAEGILRFSHGFSRLDTNVVKHTINDIAKGCEKLSYQYFGIKDYDSWSGQRSDHTYGYGPTHGYIVFSIGLKNPNVKLTQHQQDACLYYLYQLIENEPFVLALVEREKAQKKAKAW